MRTMSGRRRPEDRYLDGGHNVKVSIRLCESRRAGANPVGLPTFITHKPK